MDATSANPSKTSAKRVDTSGNQTGVVVLDNVIGALRGSVRNRISALGGVVKLDGSLRKSTSVNVSRTVSLLLASACLMGSPLMAGSASAPMTVSVQVLARAIVTVEGQQTIEITADDLARGYLDLTTPLYVRGRTNSRRGYLLQVQKTSEEFASIDLAFPNATMNVAAHESWIQRPYVRGGEVVPVNVHLVFGPGATAGTHALPISFTASPL